MSLKELAKEQEEKKPESPKKRQSAPYIPQLHVDLNDYTWIQRGNRLECVGNPDLTAHIPDGKVLIGKKGNYELVNEV